MFSEASALGKEIEAVNMDLLVFPNFGVVVFPVTSVL